jgi:hypothetical protein
MPCPPTHGRQSRPRARTQSRTGPAIFLSVHHHHRAATLNHSYLLPPRRQAVCDELGGDPVQPRRCRVPAACYGSLRRRGLRFRHHQPGWLVASTGLCYSPVRSSQAVADRRSKVWGGTAGHGEGVARATRSRWALGARGRAGTSRDFYSISSYAELTHVWCPGGY